MPITMWQTGEMTLLNLLLISVVFQPSNSCEEVCFDHWRLNFLERWPSTAQLFA